MRGTIDDIFMNKDRLRPLNSYHQGIAAALDIPVIKEEDCSAIQYFDQSSMRFEAYVGVQLRTVNWVKFVSDLSESGGYEPTSLVPYLQRCVSEADKTIERN